MGIIKNTLLPLPKTPFPLSAVLAHVSAPLLSLLRDFFYFPYVVLFPFPVQTGVYATLPDKLSAALICDIRSLTCLYL